MNVMLVTKMKVDEVVVLVSELCSEPCFCPRQWLERRIRWAKQESAVSKSKDEWKVGSA